MPMKRETAEFGEWTPDRSSIAAPANEAKGVIFQQGAYAPVRSPQSIGPNAKTTNKCLGIGGFYDANGTPQIFVGDSGKLYRIEGRTAVDRSKSGGYVATADKYWVFEQFGSRIYAVFPGVNTQVYDLASSTAFADAAGAPQGEAIGRVREFLLIGNGQSLLHLNFSAVQGTVSDNTFDGSDIGMIIAGSCGNLSVTGNTFTNMHRDAAQDLHGDLVVVRRDVGLLEDRFFATVFLGSGLLFVAMLFATVAVARGLLDTFGTSGRLSAESEAYAVGRSMAYALMNPFGMRMAAVFIFVTSSIGLRTGFLARWVSLVGCAVAMVLLLVITDFPWIALLLPSWVLLVSLWILATRTSG